MQTRWWGFQTLDFSLVDVAWGQPACQIIIANVWDFHISLNFTDCLLPSPKFSLSIVAKTETICMYYVSKRGPNTCKKQMFSFTKIWYGDISSVILLLTSFQSNSGGHAFNITCPCIEYHMPKVTVKWNRAPTIIQNAFHAFRIKN